MKKVLAIAVLCLSLILTAKGQDTITKFDNVAKHDSLFVINRTYAGILTSAKFSVDSFRVSKWASARAGAWVTFNNKKKNLSLDAWGIIHGETTGDNYSLSAYWMNWKINPNVKFSIGELPTPTGEFRPHPVSGDGHFETVTEALLPGVATGAKVSYTIDNAEARIGGFINSKTQKPFVAAKLKVENAGMGAWYENEDRGGLTVNLDYKHFYTIGVIANKTFGNFLVIKTKYCDFYSDVVYDANRKTLPRGEWGIIKNFKSEDFGMASMKFSGLVAIGYQSETKTINTVLFLHF